MRLHSRVISFCYELPLEVIGFNCVTVGIEHHRHDCIIVRGSTFQANKFPETGFEGLGCFQAILQQPLAQREVYVWDEGDMTPEFRSWVWLIVSNVRAVPYTYL